MTDRFAAIVIAAGESRRMGTPKQLLDWQGHPFVAHIVNTLQASPVDEIVVVLGHHAGEISAKIPRAANVRVVVNPRYLEGMVTTIQCGIASLADDVRAAFIALVDQPQMKASTLVRLREVFETSHQGIIVPSFHMRRGHPLLIDLHRYRAEILAIDGPPGLQTLLRDHPDDILHITFDNPSVLADLDTPDDYRAALEAEDDRK